MSYSQTLDAPSAKKHVSLGARPTGALDALLDAAERGGTGVDLGRMSRAERRRYLFSN